MKYISIIIKNIRNLLPYFTLIAIYFFFVNLEARKGKKNILNTEKEDIMTNSKSSVKDKEFRIIIPVIPYKK